MSGFGPVDYVVTGQEFDIELSVIGSPVLYRGADVAPIVVSRFLPKEWLCEFCGRANKLDQIQCGSCGWYRGLITDVVKEAGLW